MGQQTTTSEHVLARTFLEVHHELVGLLFGVVRNWEDARDAAQAGFVKCWKVRHELENVRDLRSWLIRVCLNAARDIRRREEVRRAVPLDALGDCVPVHGGDSAEDEVVERERLGRLQTALRELRPAEREVFVLRQDTGLTYEEIADARGYPVGTVKTLMRMALRKLRKRLVEGPPARPLRSSPVAAKGVG